FSCQKSARNLPSKSSWFFAFLLVNLQPEHERQLVEGPRFNAIILSFAHTKLRIYKIISSVLILQITLSDYLPLSIPKSCHSSFHSFRHFLHTTLCVHIPRSRFLCRPVDLICLAVKARLIGWRYLHLPPHKPNLFINPGRMKGLLHLFSCRLSIYFRRRKRQ